MTAKEYGRFASFTFVGIMVNVTIATSVVTFIGDGGKLFANIGALSGVFVSLMWNFWSYKNMVFRDLAQESKP